MIYIYKTYIHIYIYIYIHTHIHTYSKTTIICFLLFKVCKLTINHQHFVRQGVGSHLVNMNSHTMLVNQPVTTH